MDKSSRKAILYNMSSQALMQAVIFVVGLLVPRYILLYYGSEVNGIATTVSQIINYASLLEAGLGLASIQALYKPLAAKDQAGINGICAATRSYYFKIWSQLCIIRNIHGYLFTEKLFYGIAFKFF